MYEQLKGHPNRYFCFTLLSTYILQYQYLHSAISIDLSLNKIEINIYIRRILAVQWADGPNLNFTDINDDIRNRRYWDRVWWDSLLMAPHSLRGAIQFARSQERSWERRSKICAVGYSLFSKITHICMCQSSFTKLDEMTLYLIPHSKYNVQDPLVRNKNIT